jgi:dTDP-4-dehydrorhamnose 3,5-epimerase-like enzyme
MTIIQTLQFTSLGDRRGQLVSLEGSKNIPFNIKRVYYMFDTLVGTRRGHHAHLKLEQILVCTSGSCCILLDDGKQKQTFRLNNPHLGLYVHNLLWREIYDFSSNCVLMVLASEHYDETDYIRDYDQFLALSNRDSAEVIK